MERDDEPERLQQAGGKHQRQDQHQDRHQARRDRTQRRQPTG